MKKLLKCSLLFILLAMMSVPISERLSIGVAFADPPSWAPAHGWRRKHGGHDEDDDRRREHREERHDEKRILLEDKVRETVESRIQYEEIFRRLDINRDGRISRSEFTEGGSLFERLDRNHDGILTRDEYDQIDEQRGFVSGLIHKLTDKISSFWSKLF